MAQIKIRRMTDAARQAITFAAGEPIFTTDTKKLYVGDGVTVGGVLQSGGGASSVDYNNITNKPTTFAPTAHSHAISDITGLQTALNDKQTSAQVGSLIAGALADFEPPTQIAFATEAENLAGVATDVATTPAGVSVLFAKKLQDWLSTQITPITSVGQIAAPNAAKIAVEFSSADGVSYIIVDAGTSSLIYSTFDFQTYSYLGNLGRNCQGGIRSFSYNGTAYVAVSGDDKLTILRLKNTGYPSPYDVVFENFLSGYNNNPILLLRVFVAAGSLVVTCPPSNAAGASYMFYGLSSQPTITFGINLVTWAWGVLDSSMFGHVQGSGTIVWRQNYATEYVDGSYFRPAGPSAISTGVYKNPGLYKKVGSTWTEVITPLRNVNSAIANSYELTMRGNVVVEVGAQSTSAYSGLYVHTLNLTNNTFIKTEKILSGIVNCNSPTSHSSLEDCVVADADYVYILARVDSTVYVKRVKKSDGASATLALFESPITSPLLVLSQVSPTKLGLILYENSVSGVAKYYEVSK